MKISKERLKQIINEEVQNYKRHLVSESINENNEMNLQSKAKGKAMGLLETAKAMAQAPSHEPAKGYAAAVAKAAGEIVDLMVELEGFQASRSEPVNEGQPVMDPEEVQTVAQVVEDVVAADGDLTAIGDALEQAGLKIQRGYRYIMVFVKYAKIMIAPTSAVELEGNETVVGNFAVGEMQE